MITRLTFLKQLATLATIPTLLKRSNDESVTISEEGKFFKDDPLPFQRFTIKSGPQEIMGETEILYLENTCENIIAVDFIKIVQNNGFHFYCYKNIKDRCFTAYNGSDNLTFIPMHIIIPRGESLSIKLKPYYKTPLKFEYIVEGYSE